MTARHAPIAVLCTAMLAACSQPRAPNIILIYIDDLGWRDAGVLGSAYYETPNIGQLAADGMLFTNAYANAPNCAPSRASLLTGRYPPRHGIYTVNSAARGEATLRRLIPVENRTDLDTGLATIAEVLRMAGYVTGQVGKWHLGGAGSLPIDHGFDWAVAGNHLGHPPSYFFPYENATTRVPDLGDSGHEGEYLTDRLTTEAVGFIRTNRDRPFFLFLSHYAVHTPIQGKTDLVAHYRSKATAGGHADPAYAAMVHSVDESVGRILRVLDELDIADNTVVVFHSDNGGFGPVTSMDPLRGSKGMLYEGGIRVPLIVRWPGRIEAGSRSDSPVIGIDLFPTFLDIADTGPSTVEGLDGRSLLPLLQHQGDLPERPLYWHFPAYLEADRSVSGPWRTTPASAIRLGRYKLLTFFEDQRVELYDLAADVGERQDLSLALPDVTAALHGRLTSWWAQVGAWIPTRSNPDYVAGAPPQSSAREEP